MCVFFFENCTSIVCVSPCPVLSRVPRANDRTMDHLAKDFSVALEDFKSNRFRTKKYHSKRRNRFCSSFTQRKSSDPDSSSTASVDHNWMETELVLPTIATTATIAPETIGTFRHPSLIRYHSDSDEQSHSLKTKRPHQIHLLKNLQKPFAVTNSLSSILFQRSTTATTATNTKRKKKLKRLSHHHHHHHHHNHHYNHNQHHHHHHHHQQQQQPQQKHFLTNYKQRSIGGTGCRRQSRKQNGYYSNDHDDHMNVASESSESTNWSASEGGGNDGDDELTDHNTQADQPSLSSLSSSSSSSSPAKTNVTVSLPPSPLLPSSMPTAFHSAATSVGISSLLPSTSSIVAVAATASSLVAKQYCCRQLHSQKLTQAQKRALIKDWIQSFAKSVVVPHTTPLPLFASVKPSVDVDIDNDDDGDDEEDDEDRPLRRPCNELEFCLTCSLKFAEFIHYLIRTYQWWRSIAIDTKTYDRVQHIRLVRNLTTARRPLAAATAGTAPMHRTRSTTVAAAGGRFLSRY